jgi:outer membrane protein OmpA-like peptidoglycan-associated protein
MSAAKCFGKLRARSLTRSGAMLTMTVALAACQSAPPPKEPSLGERQARSLQALGFSKGDEGWLLRLPEPIWFGFDKAEMNPGMQHSLDSLADDLHTNAIRKLRIEGHSDNIGPRQVNIELSRRRAEVVAREFIAHGFGDANIERIAFGPDRPAASNDTAAGRAQNRRVEIIVPSDTLGD